MLHILCLFKFLIAMMRLQKGKPAMPNVNIADSHETEVNKQLSSKSIHKNNLKMKELFNDCFSFLLSVMYGSKSLQPALSISEKPTNLL